MITNRGKLETPRWARQKRAVWGRVIIGVVVTGLVYSLVRLQVVRAEEFSVVARENMLRPVTIRAPRGTIYDRHGRVIAENRVAYSIQLMPAPLDMNRKHGRPFERFATPREKSRERVPFDRSVVNRPAQDLPVYGYGAGAD